MIEDIRNIKSGEKELREFGVVVGLVLILFGAVAMFRGKPFYPYLYGAGLALAAFGVLMPKTLKPLQKAWMASALVIGFVMSRLILGILFYLVMTPIGLLMKLFGKDLLDERLEKEKASYWIERGKDAIAAESYEKQF
jgi:multisubunit Na+/H+ antiporter MnhG subunit